MSDNKVRLPKKVAEAIESSWELYQNNAHPKHIVLTNWRFMDDFAGGYKHTLMEFYKDHPVEYVNALVNGYEVEETPEDKVRYLYENNGEKPHVAPWEHPENRRAYRRGITDTLDSLKIKIEGINL